MLIFRAASSRYLRKALSSSTSAEDGPRGGAGLDNLLSMYCLKRANGDGFTNLACKVGLPVEESIAVGEVEEEE